VDLGDDKGVRKVAMQRSAGPLEVERKGEDQWEMRQPFQAPADKADVDSLIGQIKSAEADSYVVNPVPSLAKYGLDKPRLTIQVFDKNGEQDVLFGSATKDGKVYAARRGDSDVALVTKSTFDGLDKKSGDLRDKKLITLQSDKVSYLELHNPQGSIRLQKVSGNEWQIADAPGPKHPKAKGDQVQRIIDDVLASASRHVEEAPKHPARYGLDKPVITVSVNSGTGTSQVLRIGKKSPTGDYYAQGVPNAVFEIPSYVYTDLTVKPGAFQDTAGFQKPGGKRP
jgi:hypothetical protein